MSQTDLQRASHVMFDNDNDIDHSFSHLSVHIALTCPEGPSPVWRSVRHGADTILSWFSCSDLVPFEIKWACTCAGNVDVVATVCCFAGLLVVVALFLLRINFR